MNATEQPASTGQGVPAGFNGHPPLGVNATGGYIVHAVSVIEFQRAPTLGGECYETEMLEQIVNHLFQRAPTLGGECY